MIRSRYWMSIDCVQAMLDTVADQGWLVTSLQVIVLMQMVVQALWSHQDSLLQLPAITQAQLHLFRFVYLMRYCCFIVGARLPYCIMFIVCLL